MLFCGVSAKQPQIQNFNAIVQEVLCDTEVPAKFESVAFKKIVKSETLEHRPNGTEVYGTQALKGTFGEHRQKLHTTYIYLNKGKAQVVQGNATWYINKYLNGKPHFRLYYQKNPVTYAMTEGDMLFVAKTRDNRLFIIVAEKDSRIKNRLLASLQTSDIGTEILPSLAWTQVFFTPGPDCENNIISRLNNAKKTVDIAVFSITNNNIADAILAAHKRGVKVRIITDVEQSKWRTSLVDELMDAGIPVRMNSELVYGAQHDKFAIFDGKEMTTGSFNWTNSATKNNCENCLFLQEKQSCSQYLKRYEDLWKTYGPTD